MLTSMYDFINSAINKSNCGFNPYNVKLKVVRHYLSNPTIRSRDMFFLSIIKLRKTKISFHEQHFAKKYIRFCEKLRKTHCVSCEKIAKKFTKKICKFCAKDLAISWKPYIWVRSKERFLDHLPPINFVNDHLFF